MGRALGGHNHVYVVYDREDNIIASGSLKECASQMGLTYSSIKTIKCRGLSGYVFVEVEED